MLLIIFKKFGKIGYFHDTLAILSRYPRDTQNLNIKAMALCLICKNNFSSCE